MKIIGAHLSTSGGGVPKAIERAHAIGANTLQVFSGSPRMWRRTSLDKINAKEISSAKKEFAVSPIFTHALYLVNLASDKPELIEKSMNALKHDLEFDAHIGGAGVVVHLGSHQGRGFEADKAGMAKRIKKLLAETPKNSTLLIENSAGQKGKIASDLSETKYLLDEVGVDFKNDSGQSRLGWCFDTCHGHAGGYGLGEGEENSVIGEIEKFGLWSSLKCIHVNDSRDDFGSGRDRHDNIGEGKLSQAGLKEFLNHEKVVGIPLITEAPGFEGGGPDKENIDRIKKLVS